MEKLLKDLKGLKGKEIEPNIVRSVILSHDLRQLQYQHYIKDAGLVNYSSIPILQDPVQVFIMIRPPQHHLPVHLHNNFWGFVIPLKGMVTESIYNYDITRSKIFIHPSKTYSKGDYIFEPFNLVHKLQNPSPYDPAITLHVRFPAKYDYNGTMIFDINAHKLAVLSNKAQQVDWNLPEDNYIKTEENAYTTETLW
jgi:hypothetical protein